VGHGGAATEPVPGSSRNDWTRRGTEGFLGRQEPPGANRPTRQRAWRCALILMGDWCARGATKQAFENQVRGDFDDWEYGFGWKERYAPAHAGVHLFNLDGGGQWVTQYCSTELKRNAHIGRPLVLPEAGPGHTATPDPSRPPAAALSSCALLPRLRSRCTRSST